MKLEIGIIGMGAMGKMYARKLAGKGYRVNGTDVSSNLDGLRDNFRTDPLVTILDDGIGVSRRSDLIFYSVPVGEIGNAVAQYGPSTKPGAIVGGHLSVKTPEIQAFEEYLPDDSSIVTCHSLHAPSVNPIGQTLVSIRHRATDEKYSQAREVFGELGSRIVEMDYDSHDKVTADTQAVTHLGFLSMGTAWRKMGGMPWNNETYVGGIDNTKILMMLRIHGGTSHVYSGLAIHNPHAKDQVEQYDRSVSDLFSLMISGNKSGFRNRISGAGEFVFANESERLMLDDTVLGEYALGNTNGSKPNSHLSLFGMVDAWHRIGINPYDNMVCQTPPFKLRLGIVEYLFRNPDLLEQSLEVSMNNMDLRRDDLEFVLAVNGWASVIDHGDIDGYHKKFERNREYFESKINEGKKLSGELIGRLRSS